MNLRIDYLGTRMDLPALAFAAEHQGRGHAITHRKSLDEVPIRPAPDAVIHAPLEKTQTGMVSGCSVANHVPTTTLLVAIFDHVGPSVAMYALHARRGNCHDRLLLHRPGHHRSAGEVVEKIESAVNSLDRVESTYPLPTELMLNADQDLGEVMADKERFADLLYTAASTNSWGSWGDLNLLLNRGDGVVKNINSELGGVLKDSRLIPGDEQWTAQRFVRYVTEHRSFIVAYGESHLGIEPPPRPFWASNTP